jgi:transposase
VSHCSLRVKQVLSLLISLVVLLVRSVSAFAYPRALEHRWLLRLVIRTRFRRRLLDSKVRERSWLCCLLAVPEVKGLGRVLKQWREPILSWHTTGASNEPSEGSNSIIKKLKRVATGFRRFDHYRTRVLLAIGGVNWNLPEPARL